MFSIILIKSKKFIVIDKNFFSFKLHFYFSLNETWSFEKLNSTFIL